MLGALQTANPVTIESASGVLFLTADSNSFIAGGSEAITNITGAAEVTQGIYIITWNTARELVHSEDALQLIGKANRNTEAGEVGIYQLNGNVTTELSYMPVAGYKAFANVLTGGTTVKADSPADTLELVAGTNIALLPDVAGKKITVAVTGKVASAEHADTADFATSAETAANCTGNAATATKLETARQISITGDATGNAVFDGSADISIALDVTSADTADYATSAGTADSVAWDHVTGKPATFPPPVATASVLGGIKQGSGLAIAADGTASVVVTAIIPPGAVQYFAMTAVPAGWLAADGATLSRTQYPVLFAAIGTTFGAGDGSTTFKLPDLRGEFIRGYDNGRGADSGRVFGSAQADELKAHCHEYRDFGGTNDYQNCDLQIRDGNSSMSNTTNTGGSETRPRNVALLACIKY